MLSTRPTAWVNERSTSLDVYVHGPLEEVIYQLDSLCNVFGDSDEQSLINLGNAELASDDPEDPLKLVLIEVRGLVTTRRREHQVDRVEQAGQRSRKGYN